MSLKINNIELYPFKDYDNYLFSKKGDVYNIHTKIFLSGSTNPAGYHNFRLTRNDGYCYTWGRHRLLVMLFKKPDLPDDVIDKMISNHINGIKGDDRLSNLELITPKENCEHAGKLGLSQKCKPVSVRDVDTGDVNFYPSATECGKKLNLTKDAILYRCKSDEEKVFPERKQYRYGNEDKEWKVPGDIELALANNGSEKGFSGKNLITGEIRIWNSMTQYSKEFNVSIPHLSSIFKKYKQPMTRQFWLLKKLNDGEGWRKVECCYSEYSKVFNTRIVMAIKGKKLLTFVSALECAKHFNILPTTLNERIKSCFYDGRNFEGWSFVRN